MINTLRLLVNPMTWVQTSIPILPFELIDILDAPMPFMVGILHEHWHYYEQMQGPQRMHLIDKCVITIKDDNSIMVQSYGFDEKTKSAIQLVGDQTNLNCFVD